MASCSVWGSTTLIATVKLLHVLWDMPTTSHNSVGIVPESCTSQGSSPMGSGMAAESKSSQLAHDLYL